MACPKLLPRNKCNFVLPAPFKSLKKLLLRLTNFNKYIRYFICTCPHTPCSSNALWNVDACHPALQEDVGKPISSSRTPLHPPPPPTTTIINTKSGYSLFKQWYIIWHILIFRYMQLRRLQKCHLDISIRHTVNDHLRNIGEYWPLLVSSYIKWCHNRKI